MEDFRPRPTTLQKLESYLLCNFSTVSFMSLTPQLLNIFMMYITILAKPSPLHHAKLFLLDPLPHSSLKVTFCRTPLPPYSSKNHFFHNPPPPSVHDIINEQPLINDCLQGPDRGLRLIVCL